MKNIGYIATVCLIAAMLTAPALADRGVPPSVMIGLGHVGHHSVVVLDEPDIDSWQKEDMINEDKGIPMRIGAARPLPADAVDRAEMIMDHDYGLVWRLAIRSPGAREMKLHLADVRLQDAGTLYIYAEGETESDIYGIQDVFRDGTIWSWGSPGDTIILEWHRDNATDTGLNPPFELLEISHVYKDILNLFGREGSCHNDVTCDLDYLPQRDASAQIEFNDSGTYVCSGTMLNSTPQAFIPYFLTANHCVSTQAIAGTVKAWFFFHTAQCNDPPPSRGYRTVAGSTLLATGPASGGSASDYALLRLNDADYSGIYFAGWDRNSLAMDDAITGIHHPDGAYKRISYGSISSLSFGGQWGVTWDRTSNPGVTEVGSSGSALFRDSNHFVVGQLWAGSSDCSNQYGKDYYGRFGNSFTHGNLGQWLGNTTTCAGAYWNGSVPTATPTPTVTATPTRTPTAHPSGTATPTRTPTPPPDLDLSILMPSTMFKPGDTFACAVVVDNGTPVQDVALFVILDVYGQFYFAPAFNEFSYYPMSFPTGETIVTVIPAFEWPSGAGSANDINWYAGVTDMTFTRLIGNVAVFTFGWTES
ncbi:trypsin-like peptidase domain-containing protein [bacterium]|nr:trypsin-like peptidase domain-containing protein [candidate division CSSED10-310 bacterium]